MQHSPSGTITTTEKYIQERNKTLTAQHNSTLYRERGARSVHRHDHTNDLKRCEANSQGPGRESGSGAGQRARPEAKDEANPARTLQMHLHAGLRPKEVKTLLKTPAKIHQNTDKPNVRKGAKTSTNVKIRLTASGHRSCSPTSKKRSVKVRFRIMFDNIHWENGCY